MKSVGVGPWLARMPPPRCGCMISAAPSASPAAQTKISATRITGPQNDSTLPRWRPNGRETRRNTSQIVRATTGESSSVPARAYSTVRKISSSTTTVTTAPAICSTIAIVVTRAGIDCPPVPLSSGSAATAAGAPDVLTAGRFDLAQRASRRAPLREHVDSARNREIRCRPQQQIERLMLEVGAVLPEARSSGCSIDGIGFSSTRTRPGPRYVIAPIVALLW